MITVLISNGNDRAAGAGEMVENTRAIYNGKKITYSISRKCRNEEEVLQNEAKKRTLRDVFRDTVWRIINMKYPPVVRQSYRMDNDL